MENKIKFTVCTRIVETRNGKNAFDVWNNCANQTPNKSVDFNTLEEARAYYATIQTRVDYNPFHRIYVHECKWIEDGLYDEDGEFIEGSNICELDFPDYKKKEDEK